MIWWNKMGNRLILSENKLKYIQKHYNNNIKAPDNYQIICLHYA